MRRAVRLVLYALAGLVLALAVWVVVTFPRLTLGVTERLRLDLHVTAQDGIVWTVDATRVDLNHMYNGSIDGACGPPDNWSVEVTTNGAGGPDGRPGVLWLGLGVFEGALNAYTLTFEAADGTVSAWRGDAPAIAAQGAGLHRLGPLWRVNISGTATMTRPDGAGSDSEVRFALTGRTPAIDRYTAGITVFDRFCGWRQG